MQDRKDYLRDYMLRRYKVDVVYAADLLQFDVPLGQFVGVQVEAILLMCYVMVLAEDTSQIASREEDTSTAISSLNAGLLSEMGRDGVDNYVRSDQAGSSPFKAVDTA
jgi:hypothetical protein